MLPLIRVSRMSIAFNTRLMGKEGFFPACILFRYGENLNMIKYVKCPRCELNYIDPEKQEYCDVCIAEMKGNKLQFADFDEDYDDENAEKTEICPVCGVNTMRYGEKMCDACKQASQYEDDQDVDMDTDEEWKNYLEDDEDLTIDDETLEEELSEELDDEYDDEESEEHYDEDDPLSDFDDDFSDDEDDDEDDDDEDDEDDDDLF